MKKILLLFSISAGIIITACSKKIEDPVVPPAAPACTLSKITNPDNTTTVIERNSSGKYTKVRYNASSGHLSSYYEYQYSGNTISKLAYMNSAGTPQWYNTYEPQSYGLLVHQFYPAGGLFNEVGQFEYHMSGARITKVVTKASGGSSGFVATKQDVYTFDGNGNVTQVVSTNLQDQSTSTTTYTYDSKQKPYHGDFGPAAHIQSTNNILSTGTTSYTITYNNSGFAATRSTVGVGNSTVTFTYTGCN